jgi:hypothetical protein
MASRRFIRNVVLNSETRLFIEDLSNRDCCCRDYTYYSCVAVGDISQQHPERAKIWCPDESTYDKFTIVATVAGEETDGSFSLVTDMPFDQSVLKKYYDRNCAFNAQIHIGVCDNPANFNTFEKALILKNVRLNSYGISTITARNRASIAQLVETADCTFETLTEVRRPTFTLYETAIIAAGPVVDSFSYCDSACCVCDKWPGHYYVQLVDNGVTQEARLIYTDDNGLTFTSPSTLSTVPLTHLISSNVITDGTLFYALGLDAAYGTTQAALVSDALKTITSANNLITYDTYGNEILIGGYNGTLYRYNTIEDSATLITTNVITELISISTLDGESYVIGTTQGNVLFGTDDALSSIVVDANLNPIHKVVMLSDCSFLAAAGIDGGYRYCDGTIEKLCGINGAITAFSNFIDGVGYAASNTGNGITIWLTVDSGNSWLAVDTQLSTDYYVNTISMCESTITASGSKDSGFTSQADQIRYDLQWNGLGTGFALIAK